MLQEKRKKFGGREKGTLNKSTVEKPLFKVLANYLIENNMQKFKNELDSLKGKDFVMAFISLYKLKPTELESIEVNDELLKIFKNQIKNK